MNGDVAPDWISERVYHPFALKPGPSDDKALVECDECLVESLNAFRDGPDAPEWISLIEAAERTDLTIETILEYLDAVGADTSTVRKLNGTSGTVEVNYALMRAAHRSYLRDDFWKAAQYLQWEQANNPGLYMEVDSGKHEDRNLTGSIFGQKINLKFETADTFRA